MATMNWQHVFILLGWFWAGVEAAAIDIAPSVINDPNRPSQQSLPELPFRTQTREEKFILPPVPKSSLGVVGQNTLWLHKVVFSGNTVFSSNELADIAQRFLDRPLSAGDLEELRQAITQHYVNAGYINSGATIPGQSVASSILQIHITEGELTEVRLQGLGRLNGSYLRDRLFLGAGSPLNIKGLQESYLLLLRDPLIGRLNGRFLPGVHPGESILDIQVSRARPYQLYLGADNYITPSVGGFAGRMGGWVSNLTGWGETVDANLVIADGLVGVNAGLDLPVNAYDTRLSFRYSDNFAQLVEEPLARYNIKTHVSSYDGGINQPLYRTMSHEFKAGANISVRKDESEFLSDPNAFLQGGAELAVVRLWQQYQYQGMGNVLVMRSTFNQGLGASLPHVRPGYMVPSASFMSWLGQAQYMHRLMDNGARLVWRGSAQLAAEPVWNLERFAIGGANTVRGYRENSYVRDNGFYTSLEFRFPLFGGDPLAKHSFHVIPFMDYGSAWNQDSMDSYNPTGTDSLHSVGIGFNWHYHQLDLEFYWAHQIAKAQPLLVNNQVQAPLAHSIQDDGLHFKVNLNAF